MGFGQIAIDGDYLICRAQDEREAAVKGTHSDARQAHLDFADAYERGLAAEQRRSGIRMVRAS